jgi:tetratricopeptide (TPR) repeat protein
LTDSGAEFLADNSEGRSPVKTGMTELFAAMALLVFVSSANAADAVIRKNGSRVGGTITEVTSTKVVVKPSTGDPVEVPANEISSIDWDDATPDLRQAMIDENASKFDSALERLKKCQSETQTSNEALTTELQYLQARVLSRQALADAGKQADAIAALQEFQRLHKDHFRYYESAEWLGKVQLAKGDQAAAQAAFELLGSAPLGDYQLAAKIATGRLLMQQDKAAEAAQSFSDAISAAGTSPAEQARKYEAMLGKARALLAQNQAAEALPVLDEVLTQGPADDSAVQAEGYLLQGNAFRMLSRVKEAVLAYLHVDVLFSKETSVHPEALYHLSQLWKQMQYPERGEEAEAMLASRYPNSEWTKRLTAPAGQ